MTHYVPSPFISLHFNLNTLKGVRRRRCHVFGTDLFYRRLYFSVGKLLSMAFVLLNVIQKRYCQTVQDRSAWMDAGCVLMVISRSSSIQFDLILQ